MPASPPNTSTRSRFSTASSAVLLCIVFPPWLTSASLWRMVGYQKYSPLRNPMSLEAQDNRTLELTRHEDCLYDEAILCRLFSSEKRSAARPLFPQLYRARKLNTPLWATTGRRVSREPGSQET